MEKTVVVGEDEVEVQEVIVGEESEAESRKVDEVVIDKEEKRFDQERLRKILLDPRKN